MVLDAALLNTQHYKLRIKGKVVQSRERSSALPLHLGVEAIELRSPTYLLYWVYSRRILSLTDSAIDYLKITR